MPTFVTLVRFTAEGAKTITGSRKRYEAYEKRVQDAGGRVVASYGLLGEYDILTIADLPSEKAAARIALATGSLGTVSTQTLTAIPIKEFYDMIDEVVGARPATAS